MNTFVLHLQSATQYECIENVESFVGRDASGSFGILAGHAPFMTSLVFGLARIGMAGAASRFVALPGALLHFSDNQLYLSTRRFHCHADYQQVSAVLDEELQAEEQKLRGVKESMRQLEQAMLKRLLGMQAQFRDA